LTVDGTKRVAIVTGSSSGIGYETALALAENGIITYATMRDTKKGSSILNKAQSKNLPIKVIELDVDDDKSVEKAMQEITINENRIDILVNNAGFGLIGAAEDLSSEEIYNQFNTNVFGVFRTIRNVLPLMRNQREGMIVNISSVNGFAATPYSSAYIASKFAIEGLTRSLRLELWNFGIKVTAVEPGAINTNIIKNGFHLAKRIQKENSDSVFEKITKDMFQKSKEMIVNGAHPQIVANLIVKIVNTKEPEIKYPVGEDAEKILNLRNKMNDKEFEEFIAKLLDIK
jgi:NAD(P)-dependent dehydrogenase (short-subunit alcohol dehydrogenase family)